MEDKLKRLGTPQLEKKMLALEGEEKDLARKILANRKVKNLIGKEVSFSPFRSDEVLTGVVTWSHIYKRDNKCYVTVKCNGKTYYKKLENVELCQSH